MIFGCQDIGHQSLKDIYDQQIDRHGDISMSAMLFYNALLLGIRGKEHFAFLLEDFKKRDDGGFTVYIYRSKTNQRGAFGNRGKADKILIPYNEEIIQYYNRYISLRPKNADPEFYLQEMEDEDGEQCFIKIQSFFFKEKH